ncbi:acetate kinase [Lysobacter arenosi]|uniref:Acetate kinase n=1 Tax=Lysobacter arenosi TaxID=2795387 RepID=A0ABX7REH9_9GAMM|nr:transporter [Lysobacter arenosi]QSX75799.1 acetate kinase [Lysobacter arenosi]
MKRTPPTRKRLMLAPCLLLSMAGIANAQDPSQPVARTDAGTPANAAPAPVVPPARSARTVVADRSATAALAAAAAAAASTASPPATTAPKSATPAAVVAAPKAVPVVVAAAKPLPQAASVPVAVSQPAPVQPTPSQAAPVQAAPVQATPPKQALVPATPEEVAAAEARLDALQREINQQTQRLGELRQTLAQQEQSVANLQRALDEERLEGERGAGATPSRMVPSLAQQTFVPVPGQSQPAQVAQAQQPQQQQQAQQPVAQQQQQQPAQQQRQQPVGEAPETSTRPPEVAQIFDQPGVLTPAGKFILEPSLQHGYSANDRVALVGFTVIPAILIGLIDVRQVKTTSGVATVTGRYGFGGGRFELEAKVPYVYLNADTVSREIFTGTAVDNVFNASGRGMGDIEATARYQLNKGGPDKAFYIGWLRYKSRTGKDIFEVVTDCVTRCVSNATGTGLPLELPTGTGFQAVQPGVTWLYPSDPVVFFGSISYLYNFERHNVSRTVLLSGKELLGDVKAGDIWGFNLGMGLALNEKASISLGYDTSLVGKTEQNGREAPGSVRVTLGTMLLGGTYRFSDKVSLNVALGVGVTRDTPDVTFTARVPISF